LKLSRRPGPLVFEVYRGRNIFGNKKYKKKLRWRWIRKERKYNTKTREEGIREVDNRTEKRR
jgi:hypothetical protein